MSRFSFKKITATVSLLTVLGILGGCASIEPRLAKRVAQPDNRPVRNFTSFTTALRCMDQKLAKAGKSRQYISSTGFPDLTGKIRVGGDEMLVNAVNQMNRKSGTYIFLDQALERSNGQIQILTTRGDKKEVFPRYYFRGAITQVDSNVVKDEGSLSLDLSQATNPPKLFGGPLSKSGKNASRGVSIVSVDMHLVSFPSRRVVAGGSVANSMMVVADGSGFAGEGLINLTGFNLTIKMSRVESVGQAVRNLIELGTLELLGRHSGLPYWECLSTRPSNERATNGEFLKFETLPAGQKFKRVQIMLRQLGYYSGPITTWLDPATRAAIAKFQASEKLIATGNLDFDLWERLHERTQGFPIEITRPIRGALNGIRPEGSKPTTPIKAKGEVVAAIGAKPNLPSGITVTNRSKLLQLVPSQSRYKVGDTFSVSMHSATSGYVACFHQSGNGPVTQVTPIDPNGRLSTTSGAKITIPQSKGMFDIKFEEKSLSEAILCVLDTKANSSVNGASLGAYDSLSPTKYFSFDDIVKLYKKSNRRIAWSIIRAVPSP